jgi:hypothetical protein
MFNYYTNDNQYIGNKTFTAEINLIEGRVPGSGFQVPG